MMHFCQSNTKEVVIFKLLNKKKNKSMAKKLKTKTLKLNSRVFPDFLRFSLNSRVFQDAGNPVLKPDRKRGNLTKI